MTGPDPARSLVLTRLPGRATAPDAAQVMRLFPPRPAASGWPATRQSREHILTRLLAPPFTLDNLAGAVSLSPYHFARSFRATTGMTPHAFVTEHRLMIARDRLLRGDTSVTGIALSVGFSNISHFRRLFRRRYGLTPAGLRAVAR